LRRDGGFIPQARTSRKSRQVAPGSIAPTGPAKFRVRPLAIAPWPVSGAMRASPEHSGGEMFRDRRGDGYFAADFFFAFAHRALAALLADSARCSAVIASALFFPPILPPFRPSFRKYSRTSAGIFFFAIDSKRNPVWYKISNRVDCERGFLVQYERGLRRVALQEPSHDLQEKQDLPH